LAEVTVVQTMRASWIRQSGLYALAQPLLAGRRVVELWGMGQGEGDEASELRQAGAAEVTSLAPETPSLPIADGGADVVLCPSFLPEGGDAASWFAEIARVLAPDGVCVLRAPVGVAVPEGDETSNAAAWRRFVPETFAGLEVVEEVPFAGVSFRVPATEELAIVGDLAPLGAVADVEIVVCAKDSAALPRFAESMLVPLPVFLEPSEMSEAEFVALTEVGPTELEAIEGGLGEEGGDLTAELEQLSQDLAAAVSARADAERERDEARLAAAAVGDRDDTREATITSLRAAVERQMQRLADIEITLGRITAERDEAVRRAEAAEGALHDTEAALRRREWEVAGLSRDIDRVGRSASGPKG
jgi:hypothetical protein